MGQILSYIRYFEALSLQHRDIKDFFSFDYNETLVALKAGIQFPALILNFPAGRFDSPNDDHILDDIGGGFLIVKNVPDQMDFNKEMIAMDEMKTIGEQIIARMLRDSRLCIPEANKAIPGFNINSVAYETIGPIFDNCWGVNFTFRFLKTLDLSFDDSKWEDISFNGKC